MNRPAPGEPDAIARQIESIREENSRLLRRLAESEKRFRLISRGVLRMQEAERQRLSRELHDGVGQSLTALKMQLELAQQEAADAALVARLTDMRELAERLLGEVREISRLLRPPMLDELGLPATLEWLTRAIHKQTGIAVQFGCSGLEGEIDPDVATLAFRVAQEALTNVARHAGAMSASVDVSVVDGWLRLSVRDPGRGFDPAAALGTGRDVDRTGSGLRGMRDRVQLFEGRFSVESKAGAGTRVLVEVPLDRGDA